MIVSARQRQLVGMSSTSAASTQRGTDLVHPTRGLDGRAVVWPESNPRPHLAGLMLVLATLGCAPSGGSTKTGTGGTSSGQGGSASAGTTGNGGTTRATGGVTGSGGVTGTGGATSSGGATGAGGAASGGATGTGGVTGSGGAGGAMGSGGATATGGTTGSGGAAGQPGSGGSVGSNPWITFDPGAVIVRGRTSCSRTEQRHDAQIMPIGNGTLGRSGLGRKRVHGAAQQGRHDAESHLARQLTIPGLSKMTGAATSRER